MNINTLFTFCTKSYDGTLFFSWELHNYQYENSHLQKLHLSLHALAPGDWLVALSNRFFPYQRGCSSNSCTVTIKIYVLLLDSYVTTVRNIEVLFFVPNVFKIFLAPKWITLLHCFVLYVLIQGTVRTFQYNAIYSSDLRSSKMLRNPDW